MMIKLNIIEILIYIRGLTVNVPILIPQKNKSVSLLMKCSKNCSETYLLCDNRKEDTSRAPQNILMNVVDFVGTVIAV